MRLIKYDTRLNEDRLPYLVREMSRNYAGKNMGNSLLAYNILKLMGRKEGKVSCKRVRDSSQWLIAVVG